MTDRHAWVMYVGESFVGSLGGNTRVNWTAPSQLVPPLPVNWATLSKVALRLTLNHLLTTLSRCIAVSSQPASHLFLLSFRFYFCYFYFYFIFYCYSLIFLVLYRLILLSGDVELNPGPSRSSFKVLYSNVRGLASKLQDLSILASKYDMILCPETLVSNI